MDDLTLGRLLRMRRAVDDGEGTAQHRDQTQDCPPLLRFRELVYHSSRQTRSERRHMLGCRYCQQTLAICEREAWHPPTESLAGVHRALDPDARLATAHVEGEQCERCRQLAPLLDRVGAYVRERFGSIVFGGPTERLSWRMASAAAGASFASEATRFYQESRSADGSLTITLRESDAGGRVLELETPDPALEGTLWRFALLTADGVEARAGFVVLARWIDGRRWVASVPLGPPTEGLPLDETHVLAHGVTPESLTETDRAALLWSIDVVANDRPAVSSWRRFVDTTLRQSLPGPAMSVLRELRTGLARSAD